MSARSWLLPGLLAVALGLRLGVHLRPTTGFATMPILTPTSLVYEAQLRQQRGQPAGLGGREALDLAQMLMDGPQSADPALAQEIQALAADRAALLALRNRRHALNTHLMEVGVDVVSQLSPAQWDAIQGGRDALRARADASTFNRLLERLRGPQ